MRVLAAAWPGAASPVQVARPGLAQAGLEELPGADIAVKCCSASAGVLWYGTACCRHCPCCPQGCMPCVNLQLLSQLLLDGALCLVSGFSVLFPLQGCCVPSGAECEGTWCHSHQAEHQNHCWETPPPPAPHLLSDTMHYRCAPEFQLTSTNAMYLQVVFIRGEYLPGQWSCSAEHSVVFWVLSVGDL